MAETENEARAAAEKRRQETIEKAKNAVLLGCGHGGICYNCSIDVYVTSGLCPFCRQDVSQIVMIGLGTTPGQERAVVQVVRQGHELAPLQDLLRREEGVG